MFFQECRQRRVSYITEDMTAKDCDQKWSGCFSCFVSYIFFYEVCGVFIPISFVDSPLIMVEIKLIHPESDGNVFRHTLFDVTVAVFHSEFFHDLAAAWIVDIMCRCDVGISGIPDAFHCRFRRFRNNSLMPESGMQPVSEIMTVAVA